MRVAESQEFCARRVAARGLLEWRSRVRFARGEPVRNSSEKANAKSGTKSQHERVCPRDKILASGYFFQTTFILQSGRSQGRNITGEVKTTLVLPCKRLDLRMARTIARNLRIISLQL